VEPPQEEEDLFARAMSGLGEDDGNAADEDSGTARDGGGRTAKKRPRESAGCEEYDAEGRVKERRVGGSGESGGARGGSKSSSINGGARPELENKFRIPSPPRCGTVPKQGSWSGWLRFSSYRNECGFEQKTVFTLNFSFASLPVFVIDYGFVDLNRK
jgi:hypothetical protein